MAASWRSCAVVAGCSHRRRDVRHAATGTRRRARDDEPRRRGRRRPDGGARRRTGRDVVQGRGGRADARRTTWRSRSRWSTRVNSLKDVREPGDRRSRTTSSWWTTRPTPSATTRRRATTWSSRTGPSTAGSVQQLAPQFPDVSFAWGTAGDTFGQPNVFAYSALSDEGGYVQGVMAAALSKSKRDRRHRADRGRRRASCTSTASRPASRRRTRRSTCKRHLHRLVQRRRAGGRRRRRRSSPRTRTS